MNNAEQHALLMTTRTPGWRVVIAVLDDLLRKAEQETFAEENTDRIALLAHEARGAHKLVHKFKRAAEMAAELPQQESES